MGSFFGNWFRKGRSEDYEQVLELLALDIQKRQTRLSEIRLRERRTTLLFSVYALALWAAYVALWYTNFVPNLSGHPRYSKFEKSVQVVPVFLGPVVILFIRRIVQAWYARIGNAEEKHLVKLRKQQKEKIAEIKKKTNYDNTRNLIERYDELNGMDSPLRRRMPPQSAPATPQRAPQPQPPMSMPQKTQGHPVQQPGTPLKLPPGLQQQLSPSPQRPMPPPRKQWYDKLADTILGDDDTITAASSRYALICQKCFTHNGLVKESMWEDAQYVCPKCGYFNPSARALRQARAGSPSPGHARSPSQPKTLAPPLENPADAGPNLPRRARTGSPESGGTDKMEVDS